MWGPNSYAWVLIQLATANAGIILVRRIFVAEWGGGSIPGEPSRLGYPKHVCLLGWVPTAPLSPQVSVNPAYQAMELEFALKQVDWERARMGTPGHCSGG